MGLNKADTRQTVLYLFPVHLCTIMHCDNRSYRTVPLSKMSNSEDLEGGDSATSLQRQVPASGHEQEESTGDVPSSNKASDATSDSSEDKRALSEVTQVRAH
jgi:hypothetical protein